jgi:hypothetical protein
VVTAGHIFLRSPLASLLRSPLANLLRSPLASLLRSPLAKKLAQRFRRSDCGGDGDTYNRWGLRRERLRRLPQIG